MRYSTSYAKPGPKSGGHLLTAPGILFRVTPPSTNQCSLTSMITWVPVCPTCQDTVLPKLILNLVLLRRRVTEKSHFSSLKVVLTGIRTRYRYYNNPCSYRVNHPLQLSYTCYPSIQQIPRDRISCAIAYPMENSYWSHRKRLNWVFFPPLVTRSATTATSCSRRSVMTTSCSGTTNCSKQNTSLPTRTPSPLPHVFRGAITLKQRFVCKPQGNAFSLCA
jgi:hypothetical protein